jgi:uncharacterized protein YbbC (DUF1343 family)/CubicO group peptidase (beta-lactamase class C family)
VPTTAKYIIALMRDNGTGMISKEQEGFLVRRGGLPSTSLRAGGMTATGRMCCLAAFAGLVALSAGPALAQNKVPHAPTRPAAQIDLSGLDAIVGQSIEKDEIPGAVVVVGRRGRIIFRKAYGSRALVPAREKMTADTIFDMASLTKSMATAPSVLLLVEQGKVRLNDPVARYVPEFGANGKEQVTVRQILTHTSGLRAIPAVTEETKGTEAVLKAIYDDTLTAAPGARFVYSDTGYIVLAELVRRVSGIPLDEFAAKNIYTPLGMKQTRFLPPAAWQPRIAPTEEIDLPPGEKAGSGKGHVLRGEVHDPRARQMGGVAGHAGLFSTASDVAKFCTMILNGGRGANGKRVLSAAAIEKATTPQTPPWSPTLRGLGWDIDSVYSSNRGDLFPVGTFGHTGFTGTSIWMDPGSKTFVILLANSVHPRVRPPILSLRSRVATLVAAAVEKADGAGGVNIAARRNSTIERAIGATRPAVRNGETKTGIDVLIEENFDPLRGKRIGLITNHTGLARDGRSTVEVLSKAEGVKLVALFSPEHGLYGVRDENVASTNDAATGLPVYSLYGETRRPTAQMLEGLDSLVFDIQDAGVRFYTYDTTMAYAMEEAAKRKIAFYVLDRPDPLGGEILEGPMLDADKTNYVGYFPVPVRHGMTVGELARMFNAENKIGADLHVIAMQDWRRSDGFDSTGLVWVAPSPNLRSLEAALLYPGIEILQAGGLSVGRGTDRPFEIVGAPWIHARELAEYLNKRFVPGVRFVPTRFTPRAELYKEQECEGLAIEIMDRGSVYSMLVGLEMAEALAKLYPDKFAVDKIIELLGSARALEQIKKGDAPSRIVEAWEPELEAFRKLRAKYLLYP